MKGNFGQALRTIRKAKGLSQLDLAATLGISRSHIGRLESGEKQPSLDMVFRIAEALDVSASSIIAAMENQNTSSKC